MQPVAFFDIDGTVFRSSLLVELVNEFVDQGIWDVSVQKEYEASHEAWKNREGSYDAYIEDVIRAFMHNIQGMHYGVLADMGRAVVGVQSKRVYRYTRDLINDLRSKGYYIVAISQSPKTILDEFCASYGFDKVYGRMYEIGPRDLPTGTVFEEHIIKDKSLIVDRVLTNLGTTLQGSIGVGDTDGDISLLSRVETPICFNPNMKLYQYAKAQGWPVVVERKDVVYTL